MVVSGPAVAAAVAMLEQQTGPATLGPGLRRVGAVSVLPRRTSTSTTDEDSGSGEDKEIQGEGEMESPVRDTGLSGQTPVWTDSVSSEESTSASASDTDDNHRDDQNTTGCDEDFQWIQNCQEPPEPPEQTPEPVDMQNKYNELYNSAGTDPGKPVTYRNKSGSLRGRKERDTKSKSSSVHTRYHSPSRKVYTDDILRGSCRNICYNCSTSCQDIPDYHQKDHHYGSTPGLDCHWLSQPIGCYHCHHRNITPYFCDQLYPQYRYFKSSTDSEEVVRRLEADKDRLSLQVSVLTEQIDAQSEKILDLEKALDEKKKQLHTAEDVLNREMLTRSSLETQKLELLALVSDLRRQQAALERDNLDLRDRLAEERRRNKPPIIPRNSPYPASSTPNQVASRGVSPSPSPVTANGTSPRRLVEHHDDINLQHQSPVGGYRRAGEMQFNSLPRQMTPAPVPAPDTPRKGVAFGRSLMLMRAAGDRSSSVPNLAETEMIMISREDTISETDGRSQTPQASPSPSLQTSKTRGIKKIFGKMKRSGSGNLDDLPLEGEFRRGGVRATAGARLGWTSPPQDNRPEKVEDWTSEHVTSWLTELGVECDKSWSKTGAQLLQASNQDVEKELSIKNPLHRKKLHLALVCLRDSGSQSGGVAGDPYLHVAGALDTAWVLRWLDDAGLPQHKDTFAAARVDGRLLHRLTVDDLATLHVTSVLHVASIRTGILVLRNQNFEANCLIRRSSGEGEGEGEVALWTNHRVMEWLRAVDLAEYAPNLRGSGVHGGLMVYEPRFTGELLASLLSIPPAKTLLRRHLLTHFKELLGREVIQQKREAEASLGYIPLTTTAKMKVPKKSQFTLKRKKTKSELDYGELVCPLEGRNAADSSGELISTSPAGKILSQGDASREGEANGSIVGKTSERNTSV
ncbi:liprin-beta-1-like [Macrosteles quadrilineatus]|uniref:liprin-beta-1-like n=1 Tax=Macrosteles quadrilineatus TaxID=74068 RepID=UPI0023E181E4|nr:liprin-beta-1-like [Macrosteles quadrilineatus]